MTTSRIGIATAFLAMLLTAAPAQAQVTSELVGQRVRVHVRDDFRQQSGGTRLELRGRVTSADGDRLVMEIPHATPPVMGAIWPTERWRRVRVR
jgi:hypothetical protein